MSEKVKIISRKPGEKRGHSFSRKQKHESSRSSLSNSPVGNILHLQRTIGNRAVQRLIKSGKIQARLTIGKPNDKYEQEADRVADKVMSMPEPKGSLVNGHSSPVQQKSDCPDCQEKGEVQTKSLAEQITPLVQRDVDEEEDTAQPKLIQRQEPDEEETQPKLQLKEDEEEETQTKLQRTEDEEEDTAQPKLQRKVDEDEETQTKLQRKEDEEEDTAQLKLQRKVDEDEETQTKLQRQEDDEDLQPKLQRTVDEEEADTISSKAAGPQPRTASPALEAGIQSLKGGGQPLPESTRSYFEPRFGADFSQVRIHADSKAADVSKSINAKAFTTGKDVVFGAGQYSPETSTGKRLLAHELTHVVQQSAKTKKMQAQLQFKVIKPRDLTPKQTEIYGKMAHKVAIKGIKRIISKLRRRARRKRTRANVFKLAHANTILRKYAMSGDVISCYNALVTRVVSGLRVRYFNYIGKYSKAQVPNQFVWWPKVRSTFDDLVKLLRVFNNVVRWYSWGGIPWKMAIKRPNGDIIWPIYWRQMIPLMQYLVRKHHKYASRPEDFVWYILHKTRYGMNLRLRRALLLWSRNRMKDDRYMTTKNVSYVTKRIANWQGFAAGSVPDVMTSLATEIDKSFAVACMRATRRGPSIRHFLGEMKQVHKSVVDGSKAWLKAGGTSWYYYVSQQNIIKALMRNRTTAIYWLHRF